MFCNAAIITDIGTIAPELSNARRSASARIDQW